MILQSLTPEQESILHYLTTIGPDSDKDIARRLCMKQIEVQAIRRELIETGYLDEEGQLRLL